MLISKRIFVEGTNLTFRPRKFAFENSSFVAAPVEERVGWNEPKSPKRALGGKRDDDSIYDG